MRFLSPSYFIGLMVVAGGLLYGQQPPTNGPVYWSTSVPDCSDLGVTAVTITNGSGGTLGYSCYIGGVFNWYAAGGVWGTSIRAGAPTTAPVGVDYTFFDTNGNAISLDSTSGTGRVVTSGNELDFALAANQPSQINLVGATSNAPGYGATQSGSVYAIFYCPDEFTCGALAPQLLYSALPTYSWTLSVPIAWDTLGAYSSIGTQWSAEGVDNGGTSKVSFVIYNESSVAATFNIYVYDSNGNLAGSGVTPSIPGFAASGNGSGTYGALLDSIPGLTNLPSGIFKILIDGGSTYSAAEILQFTGAAATTLQLAYDYPATSAAILGAKRRVNAGTSRSVPTTKQVFAPLPR